MKKKIISIVGVIFLVVLLWYLFIKPYDYLVTFKAKTSPGTINQSIKSWSISQDKSEIIEQKNLGDLRQQISFNDSTYTYNWKIDVINDSTSKVKVYVKDTKNSFANKINIPFLETDFEKTTKKALLEFNKRLTDHLKEIKVGTIEKDTFSGSYCAYISIKSSQLQKAKGMMRNYSLLNNFVAANRIELNGTPMVEITKWDINTDSIHYNFCYPIIKHDSLPEHDVIKYKQLDQKPVLKAIYNGNYITSDRAWYALLNYAKKNEIKVIPKPIEVFYNNPNMGGNELDWKTEVFMPIQ